MHLITCSKTKTPIKNDVEMITVYNLKTTFQNYFRIWCQHQKTGYTQTDDNNSIFIYFTLLFLSVWVERVLIYTWVLSTDQFIVCTIKSATWIFCVLHFDC